MRTVSDFSHWFEELDAEQSIATYVASLKPLKPFFERLAGSTRCEPDQLLPLVYPPLGLPTPNAVPVWFKHLCHQTYDLLTKVDQLDDRTCFKDRDQVKAFLDGVSRNLGTAERATAQRVSRLVAAVLFLICRERLPTDWLYPDRGADATPSHEEGGKEPSHKRLQQAVDNDLRKEDDRGPAHLPQDAPMPNQESLPPPTTLKRKLTFEEAEQELATLQEASGQFLSQLRKLCNESTEVPAALETRINAERKSIAKVAGGLLPIETDQPVPDTLRSDTNFMSVAERLEVRCVTFQELLREEFQTFLDQLASSQSKEKKGFGSYEANVQMCTKVNELARKLGLQLVYEGQPVTMYCSSPERYTCGRFEVRAITKVRTILYAKTAWPFLQILAKTTPL